MSPNLETIPTALGKLRKELIEQGFDENQAFQIVIDLIRRGDSPHALFEE